MKKVGLVCNYYILNYGSALQCYATERTIKELGYDVEAIQFANIPTFKAKIQVILKLKLKQLFKPKAVIKKLSRIKNNNANQYYSEIREKRQRKFKEFIDENMTLTQLYNDLESVKKDIRKYDVVVLGSDQLLNPRDIILGYHTLSFAPDDIKKISYAASFGLSKLPATVKKKASQELSRFDEFSAREIRGAEIYKELTKKDAPVVVDPTMLVSAEEWRKISGEKPIVSDKYIYCYFIGENKVHRQVANKLKELTGYKIVSIRHIDEFIESDESFGDVAVNEAGPKEFVNLVSNAEYVLADSFHATIFSILFNRKFFLINRFANNSSDSTNSRLDSLLKILHLEDRRIESVQDIERKYKEDIEYSKVDKILFDWITKSKEYLSSALEK